MMTSSRTALARKLLTAALACATLALGTAVAAGTNTATVTAPPTQEVKQVTFASQYGLTYLPFMVMNELKLVEKHAKEAGLKDLTTEYKTLSGPAPINDAILSGGAQFGAVGVPSLITLWDKTKGDRSVKMFGSMTSAPMFLNTTNASVKSLKDFKDADRIALPSVKVSVQAVTLQMAVAQAFGETEYAKLDKQTVAMSHPDGTTALLTGSGGITAHFTAPPFQYQQLKSDKPKVSRVLSSYDVLGGKSTFVVAISTERFTKENPKTFDAVCKALAEAQDWINANKKQAAEIYIKTTKAKDSVDDILAQMNDPDLEYTVVPNNVFKYAEFMNKVGTIKNKAASWKDLCFPNLHDKAGS